MSISYQLPCREVLKGHPCSSSRHTRIVADASLQMALRLSPPSTSARCEPGSACSTCCAMCAANTSALPLPSAMFRPLCPPSNPRNVICVTVGRVLHIKDDTGNENIITLVIIGIACLHTRHNACYVPGNKNAVHTLCATNPAGVSISSTGKVHTVSPPPAHPMNNSPVCACVCVQCCSVSEQMTRGIAPSWVPTQCSVHTYVFYVFVDNSTYIRIHTCKVCSQVR